jgi:hypothetical protein
VRRVQDAQTWTHRGVNFINNVVIIILLYYVLLQFIIVLCFFLSEECRLRVFENKVLRRIFGPKRDEVTGEWRRLHNEKLYALYSSPNIIRVMKSRRLRRAGNVACTGERRGTYRRNLREGYHLEDPGVEERIILKWIFKRVVEGA